MNKSHLSLLAPLGILAAFSGTADAARLSFAPSAQRGLEVGGRVTADLVVSDLGETGAPSLGGFSVEILFDEAVLGFNSASFGGSLGAIVFDDPFDFTADAYGEVTPGTGDVALLETSYLLPAELDALQSDSFVLATLAFDVASLGSTTLSFGAVELTNAFGNVIADPKLNNGFVPIPATASLMVPGLGLMGWLRRRRKARASA